MRANDPELAAFRQQLFDAGLGALHRLPKATTLWTRTVHLDGRGRRHIIVRWVDPNNDDIRFVNVDPALLGFEHSDKEDGAYVVDEIGTDAHALITMRLGEMAHEDPGWFNQRGL